MYNSDQRILRLIDLLLFQKKIAYVKDFCAEIGIQHQNLSKVKKGETHFTVLQIEKMCKSYNVNANWIFGLEKKVFNTVDSIELEIKNES